MTTIAAQEPTETRPPPETAGPAGPAPTAIAVEAVSKRFRIRRQNALLRMIQRRVDPGDGEVVDEDEAEEDEDRPEVEGGPREIWALRDVSFEIPAGIAAALLGPHGSGKSTLLRILARVASPTTGQARVRGRVLPMLDSAAKLMQRDQTVRQNIVLLARFYDIPRQQALARSDEILELSELARFERLPLDRLAAGHHKRLPLATLLCLEPDVLLADEGAFAADAVFRERCFAHLERQLERGLTLLMATHDLSLVRRLCTQAVFLDDGAVPLHGGLDEVLPLYEFAMTSPALRVPVGSSAEGEPTAGENPDEPPPRPPEVRRGFNEHLAIHRGWGAVLPGGRLRFSFELEAADAEIQLQVGIAFVDRQTGASTASFAQAEPHRVREAGTHVVAVELAASLVPAGDYDVGVGARLTVAGVQSRLLRRELFSFRASGGVDPNDEPQSEPVWVVTPGRGEPG